MSNWDPSKRELLAQTVEHIDIKRHNVVPLVESMKTMAYSARDLARAADIYDRMVRDSDCGIIICLAGSLISAGLKQVLIDLINSRMCDAIVSTGANIVDQDFFEALGFRHYVADEQLKSGMYDGMLREHGIDRIYDTLIDEDELRICDETVKKIADALPPRPYSSRELIQEMGPTSKRARLRRNQSCRPLINRACRSSAPRFPIARPAWALLRIITSAAARRRRASTAPKISTS